MRYLWVVWALFRRWAHCLVRFHRAETHSTVYGVRWLGCECGRTFWGRPLFDLDDLKRQKAELDALKRKVKS